MGGRKPDWDQVFKLDQFECDEWTDIIEGLAPADFKEEAVRNAVGECRRRLWRLAHKVKKLFEDKEEVVDLMLFCAVAHEPMLLIGPPGAAKGELVARFCEGLRLSRQPTPGSGSPCFQRPRLLFSLLLTPFTEPDELLGPVNIERLKEGRYERVTTGMLPDASVAFLDELFRANSASLNCLLSLLNERVVYEAGGAIPARTRVVFGASNATPTAPELMAFYERFPIRVYTGYVPDQPVSGREELLKKAWKLEVDRSRPRVAAKAPLMPRDVSCLNDLILVHRAMIENWGGAELVEGVFGAFIKRYIELVTELNHHHRQICVIDDRKFGRLFKIMRARAFLNGPTDAQPRPPNESDLCLLRHTWRVPEDRFLLATMVPGPEDGSGYRTPNGPIPT